MRLLGGAELRLAALVNEDRLAAELVLARRYARELRRGVLVVFLAPDEALAALARRGAGQLHLTPDGLLTPAQSWCYQFIL